MQPDATHVIPARTGIQGPGRIAAPETRIRGEDRKLRAATTQPLLRRLATTYLILALAVFAFPGGLVSWLDEHNASGWLNAPLALARGVDAASAAVGLKPIGQRLRKGFAAALGDDE